MAPESKDLWSVPRIKCFYSVTNRSGSFDYASARFAKNANRKNQADAPLRMTIQEEAGDLPEHVLIYFECTLSLRRNFPVPL